MSGKGESLRTRLMIVYTRTVGVVQLLYGFVFGLGILSSVGWIARKEERLKDLYIAPIDFDMIALAVATAPLALSGFIAACGLLGLRPWARRWEVAYVLSFAFITLIGFVHETPRVRDWWEIARFSLLLVGPYLPFLFVSIPAPQSDLPEEDGWPATPLCMEKRGVGWASAYSQTVGVIQGLYAVVFGWIALECLAQFVDEGARSLHSEYLPHMRQVHLVQGAMAALLGLFGGIAAYALLRAQSWARLWEIAYLVCASVYAVVVARYAGAAGDRKDITLTSLAIVLPCIPFLVFSLAPSRGPSTGKAMLGELDELRGYPAAWEETREN